MKLYWIEYKEDCGRDDWSLLVWATSEEEALAAWKNHWRDDDEIDDPHPLGSDRGYGEPSVHEINLSPPKTRQAIDWHDLGLSDYEGGPKP